MVKNIEFPKCVVFDLDYTLWPLWIDTHVTAPFKPSKNDPGVLIDKYGTEICFYSDITGILQELRNQKVTLCVASRTCAPKYAKQALNLMKVPIDGSLKPAIEFFTYVKAWPGSKMDHFKEIHNESGIDYREMVFFDDESRNREVERLGVTFLEKIKKNSLNILSFLKNHMHG
ncbi:HAD superfamily hydrolase, unknown role [Schizosaccharomyces pombe]|uniref:HAD-like hydrolase superfamily protein P8B7.31 n=1 Tax=Schizosaccharomyces pombe (strain 972 / ATCC 24843) TaxID=284812 RepID=MGDP1_SCHPO|nr:putative acid phosphatase [Schizosaccharomyces pombe]O94279.2 RecName: Full=HAD-like hydrolase superfamily protein P8B7.31 [Schizosaccharomyces pombe 972h-]CAA21816.2 acid phosphatase (predicted) [Schizosaccharomyces pombe]|eukprot:NP_596538.2 putative acid phosphatase [Schizosaccharomyces pombe]